MTTRPGQAAIDRWATRTHRACNLVAITRRDGFVLRFTDHDRTLTFEGNTYTPALFAGMSAERREGALRTGNQDLYGIIDGNSVLIPDLMGSLYRGAEVAHVVTDWAQPWLVIARHRKWIRTVNWSGSAFTATLEGRSQVLHRPAGGRFGGRWTERCPYILGGTYCKKDISAWDVSGAPVDVITSRMEIEFDSAAWINAEKQTDDFFRDGEIEWLWAEPIEDGSPAVSTTTTLTDPAKSWDPDEHVGRYVRIANPGGVDYATEWALIESNTATVLNYSTGTIVAHPGAYYDICPKSRNHGHISPIVRYFANTRGVTILRPTPYPILVGDSGVVRVGCDGLYGTCVDKFANGVNFGGSPLEPTAARLVQPARDS